MVESKFRDTCFQTKWNASTYLNVVKVLVPTVWKTVEKACVKTNLNSGFKLSS